MSMLNEYGLLDNFEYIREFIYKHNFDTNIHIQCLGAVSFDNVKTVVFNEKDIPDGGKISLEDIKYDIDSDLPKGVFEQWLKYRKETNENVSYIYWMTQIDKLYIPDDFDNSSSVQFMNEILDKIGKLENNLKS